MAENSTIAQRLFHDNVLPACATSAVLVAGNLVDAAVTGQCLGKAAVAAFGIANPILLGVIGLSGMLGVGTVIEIGQALGRGAKEKSQPILSTALAAGAALGLLIMLCLIAFPRRLAAAMGARPELLELAADYLRGFGPGVPAFFLQLILGFVMPLDGDRERVVAAMAVSTAVNITLDLLNGYVFHLGLFGMALATSASYWAELGVLALHFRRREKLFHFSLLPFAPRAFANIARNGAPYALQLLLRMLGVILINRIILSISTTESVAVFSLLMSSANLILIDGTAVGSTVLTVENCFVGEEDARSITDLMRTTLRHAVLVNLCVFCICLISAPLLLRLFTRDASVYLPAIRAFRLFSSSVVIYVVNFAFRSHLQCIRRTLLTTVYAAVDVLIGPVAAAFCLSRWIGVDGVWLSYALGELLALLGLLVCAAVRNRRPPRCLADVLFLNPDWERADTASLRLTIHNDDSALVQTVTASEATIRFLLTHGADRRQAYLLGVCTEELCSNIVRHGFKKKEHTLEICVREHAGAWILRIRDNCAYFNVSDHLKIQEQQREKLGLRLVQGLAQEVQYISALKINNVVIRVSTQKQGVEKSET